MKELQVLAYCDNSLRHGHSKVAAVEEHIIGLDGQSRVVDLCAECGAGTGVLGQIATLMANGSVDDRTASPSPRKRAKKATPALPTWCPVCGFNSASRPGLGAHLRFAHQQKFGDFPGYLKHASDYEGLAHTTPRG